MTERSSKRISSQAILVQRKLGNPYWNCKDSQINTQTKCGAVSEHTQKHESYDTDKRAKSEVTNTHLYPTQKLFPPYLLQLAWRHFQAPHATFNQAFHEFREPIRGGWTTLAPPLFDIHTEAFNTIPWIFRKLYNPKTLVYLEMYVGR